MKTINLSRRGPLAISLASALIFAACGDSSTSIDSASTDVTDTQSASTEVAASDESSDGATSDYLGSYTLEDAEFGTMVTVTVDGATRSMQTNALPDHETGEFPNEGNPNAISAQDVSYSYTTEPTYVGEATEVRTTGVGVNGLKFEPGTAETVSCDSGETLRVEALQDIYNLGLDFNNAHVQPTGEYHYHGLSQLMVDIFATDEDLVHVGFAADGYLIYASKSGAYSSGYSLSTETRTGTDCVGSQALGSVDVELDGTAPDGTYTSDWVWSDSTGDLDSCNGVEINGTYAYVITNEYPYVGRCLNGEVSGEGGPGGAAPEGAAPEGAAPEGAAPEGAAPGGAAPDLTEAAATLGITVDELRDALGGLPPDFDAAAEKLGITVDELTAAMPQDPN